ncbi:NAD(P)-binding protein [Mycena polygramma]|nr:NAD(P)-binding protein [Mycena polygramma]
MFSSKFRQSRSIPCTLLVSMAQEVSYLSPTCSDYKFLRSIPSFLLGRPHVIAMELAGIITDPNGSEFKAGDKHQYAVLPSSSLAIRPDVSAVEAAGLTIVNATAYQAVVETLHVESGQTVFINGGSSAVGLAAIQIAKSIGCKVVATASAKNKDLLLGLGVDEFIDYTAAPLVEQLLAKPPSPKFHALFDAVGLTDPSLYLNSASYIAPGGMYLSAGTLPGTFKELRGMVRLVVEGKLRPTWLGGVPHKYGVIAVRLGKKDIEGVRDLTTKGTIKPIVDSVHTFDQEGVLEAFEKLMSKHARGKVVVKVAEE